MFIKFLASEPVAEYLVAESEAVVSVAPVPNAAIKHPVVADPIALVSPVAEASVADPDGNEPGLVAVEQAVPDVVDD